MKLNGWCFGCLSRSFSRASDLHQDVPPLFLTVLHRDYIGGYYNPLFKDSLLEHPKSLQVEGLSTQALRVDVGMFPLILAVLNRDSSNPPHDNLY